MSLQSKSSWLIPDIYNDDFLSQMLEGRGITNIESFLSPKLEDIPSFTKLFGAQKSAKKILKFAKAGKKIVIHGDYDADGICATSILWEFLYREVAEIIGKKVDVIPYIPSRVDQGYGLTESSLNDVIELGGHLLISVDCGVRDGILIKQYTEAKKLEFVITDHHQPPENITENLDYCLVHQMIPGSEYPFKEISGTAVVFLLIQAIKNELKIDSDITPDTKGLDLVALSTITDIMPLRDINRAFVVYGLKQIRKNTRLGLSRLILKASLESKDIDAYHLGYVIGPRINAVGRIGSPLDGVKILVSNEEKLCNDISTVLNDTNFERQKMTSEILEIAEKEVKDENNIIFILGKGWHEGVIGLVAGKLQEKYYKPVIVATNNDGVIKGSARSIKGFNITKTLEKYSEYLERYGGHELAAGFTAKEESIDDFIQEITNYANEVITEKELTREIKVDLSLESDDINFGIVEKLKTLEPYGYGNPKPVIYLHNLTIVRKNIMGKDKTHMKLVVKGTGIDLLTLIMFNCFEDVEILNEDDQIDVIGYPDINVWNGNESIQFNVKEWRYPIS